MDSWRREQDSSPRYARERERRTPYLNYDDTRDFGERRESADRSDSHQHGREVRSTHRSNHRSHYSRSQGAYRSHFAERSVDHYVPQPPYTGENDVATDGKKIRFLIVRCLKESVDEELLAKGLEKLYKTDLSPSGATPGSLRRVLLIRDKYTDKSMTFGFAEYHEIEDAKAAVDEAQRLGEKCTISSKAISVDFADASVFPHNSAFMKEHNPKYLFEFNGRKHKYHDPRYYPSEYVVNESPPNKDSGYSIKGAATAKEEGQMTAAQAATMTHLKPIENKGTKRKAQTAAGPAILQQWKKKKEDDIAPIPNKSSTTAVEQLSKQQTFAHVGEKQIGCYLCAAVFRSKEQLEMHVRQSAKHAERLKDEEAIKNAHAKMKQHGIDPETTIKITIKVSTEGSEDSDPGEKYIDRAALRRQEQAQVAPQQVKFSLNAASKKNVDSSTASSLSKPVMSKGMGMLQKAGWTEGQGLGASGEGMTKSLEQNLYATGVGLGHESGKIGDAVEEADRATRGDFLEKTKDAARKRYESMK